jgi:Cu/Ag efflux protein CusF
MSLFVRPKFAVLALLALLAVSGAAPAGAQSRTVHTATGVVLAVDREHRKMTIDAAPVDELGLPALALSFIASSQTLLDKVRVGQRVKVDFIEQGRNFAMTRVSPLPPAPKPAQTYEGFGY